MSRHFSGKSSWEYLRSHAELPAFEEYGVPADVVRSFCLGMGEFILGGAHGLWLEPESGDGHCDLNMFAVDLGMRMSELNNLYNGDLIRSPIEGQLVACLLWLDKDWAGFPRVDDHEEFDERRTLEKGAVDFWITPQAKIGDYKVDFLMWFACGRTRGGIVVECDGHDFHEKTKQQAARDKKRDREIVAAGYPVMRFTGSEIFRDPVSCANQVGEALSDVLHRVSREGGLF